MLTELTEFCVALGTTGPKGGQLHAPGRAVSMGAGCLLDGLAPLREGPFNVTWDYCHPETVPLSRGTFSDSRVVTLFESRSAPAVWRGRTASTQSLWPWSEHWIFKAWEIFCDGDKACVFSRTAAKRPACDTPAHRSEFRRLFLGGLLPSRARFRFAGYSDGIRSHRSRQAASCASFANSRTASHALQTDPEGKSVPTTASGAL
jgi:hypothetical protein